MLRILVTGDFCPTLRVGELVERGMFPEIYNDFFPVLTGNDINITNLECPLLNDGSAISKTGPALRAKEECIRALVYGNFNLVTLSNNHILDYGEEGLNSTIKVCKKNNIAFIGAGKNIDAAAEVIFRTIGNVKIAFLNFSENEFSTAGVNKPGSNPLDPVKNYYSIRAARDEAQYVVVLVHGGHEMYSLPSQRMKDTYRFFIDAGADIVAGHHSHCFSGYEKYGNGFIFYGLGNFIFDTESTGHPDWIMGYAVRFSFFDDRIEPEIFPYKQCDKIPGLSLLTEAETASFNEKLEHLNYIISNSEQLEKEWLKFVNRNKDYYLLQFEVLSSGIFAFLRSKKILPRFLSKKKKRTLLNIIRCEAHRDMAVESLKE